ncbi:MAG TPA: hypothetical protein VJ508_09525, partial [Saprospiraceae bacterium]|nr:hypothetical protein [Saprospiraceae bacterium]
MLILLSISLPLSLQAQGPYCVSENCTANDVQDPFYFIGDVNGTPITSVVCTPGQPVTNVYLWLRFQVTATNRYDINVIGDIFVDGLYDHTVNVCLGDYGSGFYTVMLEQVIWPCGSEMIVKNTLFSWENNDDHDVPNSCNTCPTVSSKCHRFADLVVHAPVVADFSIQASCVSGQAFEVYTFTDQTTGGTTPYSNYVWNFGPGSTASPSTTSGPGATGPFTVTYSSAGVRTITLTVTDAGGATSTRSYDINVQAVPVVTVTVDDNTICSGGSALLTASVPGWTGLTYQWQQLVGSTWNNVGSNQSTYSTGALLTGSYTYRVIVTSSATCSVVSANSVITVVADPTVSVSANPLSICIGGTSTLTATVSGGTGPTTYQWQFNNAGTWTNVGTNQNTYTTPVLNTTGTYSYRLLITQDAGCAVQSADVNISVVADPTVSVSANNPSICVGGTSTLTATVTGGTGTITYQWQELVGSTWNNVGSNQNTYTTPVLNTTGTYTYRVLVTQNPGCFAQSSNAVEVVVADLAVSAQPTSITECVGGTSTMTVTVTGGTGTISYQWQSSSDGSTGWANATGTGSTTATYTPPSTVAGTTFYRVIISASGNGCGPVVSSNATATIVPDLAVTTQPSNVNECIGGTSTMNVVVSGGTGTITYQWQSSPDGSTGWANATGTGSTSTTYTPPSTVAGTTFYRVLINATGVGCGQAVSNTATAVISGDLSVTTQPSNVTECVGGTNTMTVTVTGGSGSITYQWQSSPDGSTGWANATGTGSTSSTFTPPSTSAGTTYYRVLINAGNSGCDQAISNTATAIISPDITITTQPTNVTECVGGNNTMTVTISGGTGTINYQWQSSADGSSGWANATGTGSTTSTFTPPSTTAGTTYYRVLVNATGNGCDQSISNNAIAVISPDLVVTTQPSNVNECVGGNNTMTVVITGGSGAISYQWQSSPDGSTGWVNASGSGSTTATFTPPSTSAGTTFYRVLVNAANNGCDQVVSNNATAVINPDLTITSQPTGITECVGGINTMTVSVTGGSGTISYQWQSSADGITGWANASGTGSTTATYTPPSTIAGTTYYRVLVNAGGSGCDQAVSNTATAVITPDISITTQPNNIDECIGGNNTMTVVITGGSGTINYQWQSSTDGSTGWVNASGTGSTSSTFTPPSTTSGTTYYRVLINATNNGCDQAISNNATATINPDLLITTQPTNVNECVGGTNTMTVTITGGSGTISYQWQSSPDGSTGWANATGTGSTSTTFTPPSTSAGTTYYRVLVNATGSGCDQAVSNSATAVISPDLVITTQPSNVNECVGGTNTITVAVTGGSGSITYQWQQSANAGGPFVNSTGTGANTATYTQDSSSPGTTYYRVLVNAANNGCDQVVSNNSIVVINPDLTVTTQPSDVNECVGGTNTMTVVVSGGSGTITYQWQQSANAGGPWSNSTGTGFNAATYTPNSSSPGTTYYRVLVNAANNGCDQVVSNTATVIISPDLLITSQPVGITECVGGTNAMTVAVTGGSGTINYQWQSSPDGTTGWVNASGTGSTTNTFTPPSTVAGTTYYRVLVNATDNGCDQAVSNTATAVISPDLQVTSQPSDITECVGGTDQMTTIVTGGSGTISNQWQQSVNGTGGWSN